MTPCASESTLTATDQAAVFDTLGMRTGWLHYMTDTVVAKKFSQTLNCGHNVEYCVHASAFIAIFLFLCLFEAEKVHFIQLHTTHDRLRMGVFYLWQRAKRWGGYNIFGCRNEQQKHSKKLTCEKKCKVLETESSNCKPWERCSHCVYHWTQTWMVEEQEEKLLITLQLTGLMWRLTRHSNKPVAISVVYTT